MWDTITKKEDVGSSVSVRGQMLHREETVFCSREESSIIYPLKEFRDIYESKLKTQACGKEYAPFSS